MAKNDPKTVYQTGQRTKEKKPALNAGGIDGERMLSATTDAVIIYS